MQNTESIGDNAFIILDMIASAGKDGLAPIQLLKQGDGHIVAGATVIGEVENPGGYIVTLADAEMVLGLFDFSLPAAGYISLVQGTGGPATITVREFGAPPAEGHLLTRLTVPGSLFRVVIPQAIPASGPSDFQRLMVFWLVPVAGLRADPAPYVGVAVRSAAVDFKPIRKRSQAPLMSPMRIPARHRRGFAKATFSGSIAWISGG